MILDPKHPVDTIGGVGMCWFHVVPILLIVFQESWIITILCVIMMV